MKLIHGDCLDRLKELDDNSVDSIVTDPPYGLSFMGKKWDYDVPSQEIWEECMRVLKPGGHLLAFAGSRTYHRMAVRIEDAGFEIRDQIMWVYGSGFPKSLNIGKAVDKLQGNEREVVGKDENFLKRNPNNTGVGRLVTKADGSTLDGRKTPYTKSDDAGIITKGNSPYEGWGSALKPAHEPIVMARKPFKGTVAQNVLEWGTGGINIDESRIETTDDTSRKASSTANSITYGKSFMMGGNGHSQGRFPANIIFDEEAGKILDEQSGIDKPRKERIGRKGGSGGALGEFGGSTADYIGKWPGDNGGGASRFFYCPKASKKDRDEGMGYSKNKTGAEITGRKEGSAGLVMEGGKQNPYAGKSSPNNKNSHPTVKPTDLMAYLVRLVTPKGGIVLDPFMGSGSTGKGAVRGGFDFIGIEREEEYFEIAKARIDYEQKNPYIEETGKRVETNENAQKFW